LEEEGESRTWLQIGRSGSRIAAPAWATDSRTTRSVCRRALQRYVPLCRTGVKPRNGPPGAGNAPPFRSQVADMNVGRAASG
jgi:hypothetical protein